MIFNKFSSVFAKTGQEILYAQQYEEVALNALSNLHELHELLNNYTGAIFDNGLFKIHNKGSFYIWTKLAFEYFKKFQGNSYCFAFDWLGRQYAVNYFNNKTMILILDPATAEAFEVDKNIESFLNEDLAENKDFLFDVEKFYHLQKLVSQFRFEECFGFKQFLFLGGEDVVENYEITNMEVYWELNHQIYLKTRNLPPGTKVNLSIDPI